MNKLEMKSLDIIEKNIENIGDLFPNVIIESEKGKSIDFDMLRQELSDILIEGDNEKYQLTWPGKKEAILNSNIPSYNTLRPVRAKSVNFDTTENLYIEGDNLEVLKVLQESYLNKVDCIYIDPPYNTGRNLIYKNDYSITKEQELFETGQIDEYGNKLVANMESNGRFHSDWLSMMYSRLKLARNLLTHKGIIVLAIDDSEIDNLLKISDEIFGENNRLGVITVVHKPEGRNQEKFFGTSHEYAIFYAKSKDNARFNSVAIDDEILSTFDREDEEGKYRLNTYINKNHGASGVDTSLRINRPNFWYPVYVSLDLQEISLEKVDGFFELFPISNTGVERTWRKSKDSLLDDIKKGNVICEKDSNKKIIIYEKYRENQVIKTHWINKKYHATHFGTKLVNEILGGNFFDFPKSVYLVEDILKLVSPKNGTILDFFSGSGTTAHAVLNLNSKDNGKRKYIMVQTEDNQELSENAKQSGYKTICDIGQERIRRVSKRIEESTHADIDYGLRVYRLDSSNMKEVFYKPSDITQEQLSFFDTNIKEDRSSEDLLTQVILDLGLTLDLKIEERVIKNNTIYSVNNNSLIACFDNRIDIHIVDEICKIKPLKVVFKDASFETDNDKINISERIKKLSPETEISVL